MELLDPPGDTKVWFGKYADSRFSSLDKSYKGWCLYHERSRCHWYNDFVELNNRYDEWVVEHRSASLPKTPGATIMWFGKYKGLPFSDVCQRPDYVRWCLHPKQTHFYWYTPFKKLLQEYKDHLDSHRRSYMPRQRTELVRDIGELIGAWDAYAFDQDEDYEDDGFVVRDDDEDDFVEDSGSDFDSDSEGEAEMTEDTGNSSVETDSVEKEVITDETDGESTDIHSNSPTPPRLPAKASRAAAPLYIQDRHEFDSSNVEESDPDSNSDTEEDIMPTTPRKYAVRRLVIQSDDNESDAFDSPAPSPPQTPRTPRRRAPRKVVVSDSGASSTSNDEESTLFDSPSPSLIQGKPNPSTPSRSTKRSYPYNGMSSGSDAQTPVKKRRVAVRTPTRTNIPKAESSTDDDTPILDLYTAKYPSTPTRARFILATIDTDDDTPIVNIDRSKYQSSPRSLGRK